MRKTTKRIVTSLGTNSYLNGRNRLQSSLANPNNWGPQRENGYGGDYIIFSSEAEVGAPTHWENPYAFKVYTIRDCHKRGWRQIMWVDCSVYAIGSLQPIFEITERDGYFFQEAGHMAGTWTNDKTLEYFNITRDEAMEIPMHGNAGLMCLDFDNKKAQEFFKRWEKSMEAGMFKGAWNNTHGTESFDTRCLGHRHDMSCASIIRHQMGLKMHPGDEFMQYGLIPDVPLKNSICLIAAGIN